MRSRSLVALSLVFAVALPSSALAASSAPPFRAKIRTLTSGERKAMTPAVWRPGCPVALKDLRRVNVAFWGFGGRPRRGTIVVHRDVTLDVVKVFGRLYRSRIAIRKVIPIERFAGDDFRSIEADNTSAFNCRFVEGTRRWSQHAYGRAIDINPLENPYVSGGRTDHRRSRAYIRRRPYRKGMAVRGGAMVAAFRAAGWSWGGNWRTAKDYQHFSSTGR